MFPARRSSQELIYSKKQVRDSSLGFLQTGKFERCVLNVEMSSSKEWMLWHVHTLKTKLMIARVQSKPKMCKNCGQGTGLTGKLSSKIRFLS